MIPGKLYRIYPLNGFFKKHKPKGDEPKCILSAHEIKSVSESHKSIIAMFLGTRCEYGNVIFSHDGLEFILIGANVVNENELIEYCTPV